MKVFENESITDFIANSFADGKTIRELRLTDDELIFVKKKYPYAYIERLSHVQMEKKWYKINIKPSLNEKETIKL